MDSDRPPAPPPLFICFTSRLPSSSSMKFSSKSIFSPGRPGSRDASISLSTSLSRRLRTSGSVKGGASPALFSTTPKKRGAGFDNPEPSSPKVTCIGQVRVKSKKKQGKRLRSLSRRHSTGEASFRRLEHSRGGFRSQSQNPGSNHRQECLKSQSQRQNPGSGHRQDGGLKGHWNSQRWVHLPLTICEALRAFGSEFSCLFPCRSSCFSTTERGKEEKRTRGGNHHRSSCGAVFARWLVGFHDGDTSATAADGGGGREVDLVVEREDEDEDEEGVRNPRRHVFEDLEIINDRVEGAKDDARVSICIPPKNALLLMRCRSDPVKMEALANRFWESSLGEDEDEDEKDDEIKENIVNSKEKFRVLDEINDQGQINQEKEETDLEMGIQNIEDQEQNLEEEEEESMFLGCLFEEIVDQDEEIQETDEVDCDMEDAQEDPFEDEFKEAETDESNLEKVKVLAEETATQVAESSETPMEEERDQGSLERENSTRMLPECLLLMMCEPKLSMEVSRETWVCSTDFVRRQPNRRKPPPPLPPLNPIHNQDRLESESKSKSKPNAATTTNSTKHDSHLWAEASQLQPRRSSCSLPAAPPSMAAVLEQKLVSASGREPFVLTRCKSEPMRTATTTKPGPPPDTCFWKNKKVEPLRRASISIGAAELGF